MKFVIANCSDNATYVFPYETESQEELEIPLQRD